MESQLPQLKDIHLPTTPDLWPLAAFWWFLVILLCFAFVWGALKIKQRRRIKKQRDLMFKEFSVLEERLKQNPTNEVLGDVNILLRRLSIACYSRSQIANLTGADWLHFLDESGQTKDFSRGAGRILVEAPYRSGKLENFNSDEFIPLVRQWVSKIVKKGGGCL